MQTTYYTMTAREIILSGDGVEAAAGGPRQLVCLRQNGDRPLWEKRDNVIDLAAWRAAREEPADDALWQRAAEPADGALWETLEEEGVTASPRRPRRRHTAGMGAEWLATLSVIAVMTALLVRIIAL